MAPASRAPHHHHHLASTLALAFGLAVSSKHLLAASEEDQLYRDPMLEIEDCSADDDECALSLRQLRGELKSGEVLGREDQPPREIVTDWIHDNRFEDPSSVGHLTTPAPTTTTTEDPNLFKGDEPTWGDEDDEADDKDRGEFCCQHGQGMGATNDDDVGASCYPTAKPEPFDFCDNVDICRSECNGTWVLGWCSFRPEGEIPLDEDGKPEDPCGLELNDKGTGYNYTSDNERAVMHAPCAQSKGACHQCGGRWCKYIKAPFY